MSALSILQGTLKNFQPDNSVLAGGAASVLVFGIGCALVAAGLSIPVVNIPITMTMVAAAAPVVGHLVTAIVPASLNQQMNALATKLQTSVQNVKMVIPQIEKSYPGDTAPSTTVSNINQE